MKLFLKGKLILTLTLLSVFISVTLTSISYLQSEKELKRNAIKQLQTETTLLAEEYYSWINEQLISLKFITDLVDINYSPEMYKILQDEAKKTVFNSMLPADINGFLHLPNGATVDLSGREYIQTLFKEKKPVVSEPLYSAVEGEENLLTVLFAVPIFREGIITGALIGQAQAEILTQILNNVDNGEGSSNFIISKYPYPILHTDKSQVDNKFDVIAEAKKDKQLLDLSYIIQDMMDGKNGVGTYEFDNIVKYISYTPIGDIGWTMGVSIPEKTVVVFIDALKLNMMIIGLGGIIISIIIAFLFANALVKPIQIVSDNILSLASGSADLTKRLTHKGSQDEIGLLVTGLNTFLEKLHSIISILKKSQGAQNEIGVELATSSQESASAINQIMANIEGVRKQSVKLTSSSDTVSMAINHILSGITKLESLIDIQQAGTSDASASVEEMLSNIELVGKSVRVMSERFTHLVASASRGKIKQQEVDSSIIDISSQAELLMEANAVIAGIASQTNLLAMNAAIEAAHAGDSGKGFSVVADEIRKLSETSTSQSKSIGAQLSKIRGTITEVVKVSKESDEVFNDIIKDIDNTDQLVKQVEEAMKEQREGSNQILTVVSDMTNSGLDVKEQARIMAVESNKAVVVISDLAQISSNILGSMDEMGSGVSEINNSAQIVSNLAVESKSNTGEMEKVIGEFII